MAKGPHPSRLLQAAFLAALASGPAAAQSSGSLQLRGVVASTCTVQVVDAGTSLNVLAGENSRQVGTVQETCNSGTGYQITLSSSHAGQLGSAAGGTAGVPYTVSYGDGAPTGLAQPMTVTRPGAAFAKSQVLAVSLPAQPRATAGDYQDSLTVTIAAK
jgi:spore coat protein U-like protein